MAKSDKSGEHGGRQHFQRAFRLLLLILAPIVIALLLARGQLEDFDPAPFPAGFDSSANAAVGEEHRSVLHAAERVGDGLLPGPEDLAYDEEEGYIYTGCHDGWVKRFRPAQTAEDAGIVEDWVHVGGRPLGVALSPDGSILVAEAYKGLLKVEKDGRVILLTDEAEGLKFKLIDGVDVASDGLIYFTDASHKYNLGTYILDILEGRPNGRLMSYDGSTNHTTVIARDLYFPNGVSLSPDHHSLIFCETPLRRCNRFYIKGQHKGTIDKFVENLPGYPDNIRYDGEGHYWIGLSAGRSDSWDFILKYPFLRKLLAVLSKLGGLPEAKDGGVLSVNLQGRPVALYKDRDLSNVSGGLKVGKHLYFGSLIKSYILRIDLTKFAANA